MNAITFISSRNGINGIIAISEPEANGDKAFKDESLSHFPDSQKKTGYKNGITPPTEQYPDSLSRLSGGYEKTGLKTEPESLESQGPIPFIPFITISGDKIRPTAKENLHDNPATALDREEEVF